MDRLEAVADVGQGPADDDAHRVIEISVFHFVFDIDRDDFGGSHHEELLSADCRDVNRGSHRRLARFFEEFFASSAHLTLTSERFGLR